MAYNTHERAFYRGFQKQAVSRQVIVKAKPVYTSEPTLAATPKPRQSWFDKFLGKAKSVNPYGQVQDTLNTTHSVPPAYGGGK